MSSDIEEIKNVLVHQVLASTTSTVNGVNNPSYPVCSNPFTYKVGNFNFVPDVAILKNIYVMLATGDQPNDDTLLKVSWNLTTDPIAFISMLRSNPYPNTLIKIGRPVQDLSFSIDLIDTNGNLIDPYSAFNGKNITLGLAFDFIKFKKHH